MRLLDRVRREIQARNYSRRTLRAYAGWIRRFIVFHNKQHPCTLNDDHLTSFLNHLTIDLKVSASTQNQALSALLFLYRHVLKKDLDRLDNIVRAKRPKRLPIVLTRGEVRDVVAQLRGIQWLMAMLMYGAGLRLSECARLRVQEIDFAARHILVRAGKGDRDRRALLPENLTTDLKHQIETVRQQHTRDVERGAGWVELPRALDRKYPNAARSFVYQWLFPATRFYRHPPTGQARRHHYHGTAMQRAFREAVLRSRINKPASCHTLRHHAESRIMRSCVLSLLDSVAIPADLGLSLVSRSA